MQTYPFGRIRGMLFLGLIITLLIFGIISKCTRGAELDDNKPEHHRDHHL